MNLQDIQGIATVMALVAFLAVVFWAYSKRRKSDFSEAANQLFNEEEEANHKRSIEEVLK